MHSFVQIGYSSCRAIDKFKALRLTPMPAQGEAPQHFAECFANLECKVVDTHLVNRYSLFVVEVLKAWTDPTQEPPKTIQHQGFGPFGVDGDTIKLKSKMR